MFRFTIRDVLWLTALVAVLVAWVADHSHMEKRLQLRSAPGPVTVVLDELSKALQPGHKMEVTYTETGSVSAKILPLEQPATKSN